MKTNRHRLVQNPNMHVARPNFQHPPFDVKPDQYLHATWQNHQKSKQSNLIGDQFPSNTPDEQGLDWAPHQSQALHPGLQWIQRYLLG